jgi:CelD/BcsL family acetyltransferase involved in cellulose biosynthesis
LKIELITKREELASLTQRWDELANADSRDGFFRTSGWYLAWMDLVRPDAQPFVAVVRDESGEVIGIAPLCRLKYRDHWLPLDAISIAGREVVSGDFLDYVAAPHARERSLNAILDFLADAHPQWDILINGEVFENGDLHRAIEACAARKGFALRIQESRICPFIELPTAFDDYLAGFSKKRRHELRRQMRVLLEKLGATVEVWSGPEIISRLDTLIALHGSRWRRANQPGNMGRAGFVNFLKRVCSCPPVGSSASLFILRHEEQPIAALLIFYSGQSAFLYSMGWDTESSIASLSPGIMLVAWSIRDAIERGVRYYDFLRGDETYKSHLTKTSRTTVTVMAARSVSAVAYLRALGMKDLVKRQFPELWNRVAGEGAQQRSPSAPQPVGEQSEDRESAAALTRTA